MTSLEVAQYTHSTSGLAIENTLDKKMQWLNEKDSMQETNHRLAQYIEIVRGMKENSFMISEEIELFQNSSDNYKNNLVKGYEAEINAVSQILNINIEEKNNFDERASEQNLEITELEKRLMHMTNQAQATQSRVVKQRIDLAVIEKEAEESRKRKREFDIITENLIKESRNLRLNAEHEIHAREEAAESLKQVNESSIALYDELTIRLDNVRAGRDAMREEATMRQQEIMDEEEIKLADLLEEIRQKAEKTAKQYKKQIEEQYSFEISNLEKSYSRKLEEVKQLDANLNLVRVEVVSLNKDLKNGLIKRQDLEKRLREKDNNFENVKKSNSDDIRNIDDEYEQKRGVFSSCLEDLQSFLDTKILIDHELDQYRTMLEEEESRLCQDITVSTTSKKSHKRRAHTQRSESSKRSRVQSPPVIREAEPCSSSPIQVDATDAIGTRDQEESATGFLHIYNVDTNGRFIQIKNNSDSIQLLDSFRVIHTCDGEKQKFKFKKHSKLQPGAMVRIWSNCQNARHQPPSDIIGTNQPQWLTGNETLTVLLNDKNEKVAVFTQKMKHESELNYSEGARTNTPPIREQPEIQNGQLKEACTIM